MKCIIDVTKVAFYGATGDDRSPESFPFPACMTSLMEALGEDRTTLQIHAHNRAYTKRPMNDMFLGASGMAFGLLWHPEYCFSALDLMQVTDHHETIERAFKWAGYEYSIIENAQKAREAIKTSIDAGVPALIFGLFDTPECAIVCGYDDDGDTLIGWSHFQPQAPAEPNGMFRAENWQSAFWKLIIPGAKTAPALTPAQTLKHGAEIMQKTQIGCYMAGQAAYEEMKREARALNALDESERKTRYDYLHAVLFSLAEARCYGANFLKRCQSMEVAECFNRIHDLCWKADAVAKGRGFGAFGEPEACEALAGVIGEIQALDDEAARMLSYAERNDN